MQSVFTNGFKRRFLVALVLTLAVPYVSGCATLGIATTDELSATESRLQNSNTATTQRLDTLEQGTTDMQATLAQISTSIDTLNNRFARARAWLETMNLDTISEEAQAASRAAIDIDARNKAFLTNYLEWLKSQQALLEKQIAALEAKLQQDAAGTSKTPEPTDEKPEDSGSDSGGGN